MQWYGVTIYVININKLQSSFFLFGNYINNIVIVNIRIIFDM